VVDLGHAHQLARAFADGQLIIGVGAASRLGVEKPILIASSQQACRSVGNGYEAGFLFRARTTRSFASAAPFRTSVTTRAASNDAQTILYANDPVNQLYLPDHVTLPWDLNVGMSVQLGPRPRNPMWRDPAIEIERCKRFLRWRQLERARRRRFELARVAACM